MEEKEYRAHMANHLRRRPVERLQRARKEKECRARRVSRSSGAARPVQLSSARARHNQSAEESDNQKKRQRQGHDKFIAAKTERPGNEKHRTSFCFNASSRASVSDAVRN